MRRRGMLMTYHGRRRWGWDWDEEASTRGDLERLSGGSDFSSGYADSVFSGDSGYTGLSGVSGAFHNRALLPPRVRGNPLLDPTAPDYDPSEHLKRLTENDASDDADRFSLARGLSMGLVPRPGRRIRRHLHLRGNVQVGRIPREVGGAARPGPATIRRHHHRRERRGDGGRGRDRLRAQARGGPRRDRRGRTRRVARRGGAGRRHRRQAADGARRGPNVEGPLGLTRRRVARRTAATSTCWTRCWTAAGTPTRGIGMGAPRCTGRAPRGGFEASGGSFAATTSTRAF